MEIVDAGIVTPSGRGEELASCCFPGICVLPGGRWIVGFRAASTKSATVGQQSLLSFSDDEGKHWSTPVAPFTPPKAEGRAGEFRAVYCSSLGGDRVLAALAWVDASDPSRPFFNEETQGLLDMRVFFALSDDGGSTWSEPQLMNTTPFNVPTPLTGPVLVLPNGEWACQFELNKHYDDLTEWRHSSVLMFSKDEGCTLPEYSLSSNDPDNRVFYWDQRPQAAPDGSLLDLFWTYDNGAGKYLNIHARRSQDDGRNWSSLWDTGIPGQPAAPAFLRDGRIVMVYVDREAEPILKLRVSSDNGNTWPGDSERELFRLPARTQTEQKSSMQDAWSEMMKFSLGLPTTALLANGDVLVVFYAGPHNDDTDIHWMRIRM